MRAAPARSSAPRSEVIEGKLDDHFPLVVWQTGSGTQTNMNLNEVIANRANEMLGGEARRQGAGSSQRSRQHEPVVERLISDGDAYRRRQEHRRRPDSGAQRTASRAAQEGKAQFAKIVKIGRTHTQDATPLTLGQEFSGYAAQVESGIARLRIAVKDLFPLAQGGTGCRHRPQLEAEICKAVRQARRRRSQSCPSPARPTNSRRWLPTTPMCWCMARSIRWRPACSRSPTTFACWARARAPASAN